MRSRANFQYHNLSVTNTVVLKEKSLLPKTDGLRAAILEPGEFLYPDGAMTQTFVHGYALLIGVGQCAELKFSLPVTVKDIQALRQNLIDPALCAYPDNEQHMRLLHDQSATQQAILEGLTWLKTQATADPEATAIVYYSGHGWLETDSNRYYLIPHDFDVYDWHATALAATDFNHALHQIPAKRLLIILDCCHAAGMATAKGEEADVRLPKGVIPTADPKGLIEALKQGEGRVVFTSCRGKQSSWIRPDSTLSVYTHHLIEALQGAASQAGATEVTVFDLANHLGKAVPESAAAMGKQQNPRFEMADTERFAIALLQGGKGLSEGGWDAVKAPPAAAGFRVTTAVGERSIAVGGDVSGSNLVTGDGNVVGSGNVVQRGKYNLNAGSIRGLRVGDTYRAGTPEAFGEEDAEAEQTRTAKGFEPLPGQAQPLAATKYVCPEPNCDISWVRRSVGQAIPQCSIHQIGLVPVHRS